MDGREFALKLNITFGRGSVSKPDEPQLTTTVVSDYPHAYSTLIYADPGSPPHRRSSYSFPRFSEIFDMDMKGAITKLIESLQGNDEACGGQPTDVELEELEDRDLGLEEDVIGKEDPAASMLFEMDLLKK